MRLWFGNRLSGGDTGRPPVAGWLPFNTARFA